MSSETHNDYSPDKDGMSNCSCTSKICGGVDVDVNGVLWWC